jgi:chaperone BCS1
MMSNPFDAMAPVPAGDAGVLVRLPTASLASPSTSTELWAEPLDTPGIVPRHLVRSATASFPFLEVLQRLLHRLRFDSTTVEIEKVLALVGLYRVIKPAYNYVKDFFFWACTVQVTIPEHDPVAREVLSWMATEVIRKGNTRSAMLITGGASNFMPGIPPPMRFAGGAPVQHRVDEEVACLPPVGTRIFW